ncbi:MAG: hypothetical protein RBS24_02680 [Bacilli bacterium]|nr:hypothetical protein [Bacilli bacterium]
MPLKRVHYYILGIIVLVAVVTISSWIGAVSNAKMSKNKIAIEKAEVHTSLLERYQAVDKIVDYIETTDQEILSGIDTIKTNHTVFVSEITNNDQTKLYNTAKLIDQTFVNLVDILQDNPTKYTPFTLSETDLDSYKTKTLTVINNINTLNAEIINYNNTIRVFPNIIYLHFYPLELIWDINLYQPTLPSFN